MEHTQARMMTALAAALVAVTALLYLAKPEPEPADPDATSLVWEVDADDIVEIRVAREEGALRLVREADRWELVEPLRSATDEDQVQQLLDALDGMGRGVPIEAPGALEDYGLGDPPVAQVTVTLRDGTTRAADVGDAAPVGHRTYVRAADGGVAAVNGRPGRVLTDPASRFRDHRIFTFRPQDVRRVTLDGPEGTLSVHGQGERWWLDGFTRADPDRVDDLVVGLLDLRFDVLMDFGDLANPTRIAVVELEGGGRQVLYVGEQTPMGVVTWTDAGLSGATYADALALLGQGPTDLGDPQAFPIDLERVDLVAVTAGHERVEAVRDGPGWRVAGREDPDAQVAIDRLAEAAIHYRRDPVPPITESWAVVEIREGDATYVIDVGQPIESSWRVARDRAGGAPYLVPLHDLQPITELLARGTR